MKAIVQVIRHVIQIVQATLGEIFDEAPYARFLRRSQMASSPAAYAQFCREREAGQARRPKCC